MSYKSQKCNASETRFYIRLQDFWEMDFQTNTKNRKGN